MTLCSFILLSLFFVRSQKFNALNLSHISSEIIFVSNRIVYHVSNSRKWIFVHMHQSHIEWNCNSWSLVWASALSLSVL